MACWTITLKDANGNAWERNLPAYSGSNTNFSWAAFLQDIHQSKESLQKFLELKKEADKIKSEFLLDSKKKITQPQITNALYQIQLNLAQFGIEMHMLSEEEMQNKFGKTSNGHTVSAGISDGIIYVNQNASVTSPIHELMHLVLASMKQTNYSAYQQLMEMCQTLQYTDSKGNIHYIFADIYQEVNSDNSPYKQNMESDKLEETFCRVIESILQPRTKIKLDTLVTQQKELFYDIVDQNLVPYINMTFGTQISSGISFLKSLIQDLPLSSKLFRDVDVESNGYLEVKQKVITSSKITNYIRSLLDKDNPQIEEGECK